MPIGRVGMDGGMVTDTPVTGIWRPGTIYLLGPFSFATTLAAPLTSPYTEAGAAGQLTITDAGQRLAASGGQLLNTVSTGTTSDPLAGSATMARQAGFAAFAELTYQTSGQFWFGWSSGPAVLPDRAGIRASPGPSFSLYDNGASDGNHTSIWVAGHTYGLLAVLRATGCFLLYRDITAGQTAWTLERVGNAGTGTPLAVTAGLTTQNAALDNLRACQLAGAWATDYGIATQRLAGARSPADAFTHTANALLEFTVTTLPSAGSIDYEFRRQDGSNKWIVRVSTTGALSLIEVVAAGETSRASAAAVISNGHRVVIIADGTAIQGFSNNAVRWSYASASNFATQTSGLLGSLGTGGAVSDIVAWPRNPTVPGV